MWHAFIDFGGTMFWSICWLIIALEFALVAKEKIVLAFGLAFSFFVAMSLFTSFDTRGFFIHGWKNILVALAAYMLVGTAWAIGRWFIYALKRKNFLREHLEEFCSSHIKTANREFKYWTLDHRAEFLMWFANAWNQNSNYLRDRNDYANRIEISYDMLRKWEGHRGGEVPFAEEGVARCTMIVMRAITPSARNEKGRISLWIAFWPFSVACYLLEDIAVDVCKSIVKSISGFLNGITKSVFSGVNKDMGV